MKHQYPLVEVRWIDAVEMAGEWVEHAKVRNRPMASRSAGYLVAESDEAITVCSLVNRNHVAQGTTIPRPWITELVYLVPGSRRPELEAR